MPLRARPAFAGRSHVGREIRRSCVREFGAPSAASSGLARASGDDCCTATVPGAFPSPLPTGSSIMRRRFRCGLDNRRSLMLSREW